MSDFQIGQTVFHVQYTEKKIDSCIIEGIDIIDNYPRYWLRGYFGYFDKGKLFKTHQEASDRLKSWKIITEKFDE